MKINCVDRERKMVKQWKKRVITFHGDDNIPRLETDITTKTEGEILKEFKNKTVLSIVEVESQRTAGKCQICGKPFVLGDKVLCTNFHEHEIIFLDGRLAYFSRIYHDEDCLDRKEQLLYIVHSCHVSNNQIDQHRKGKQLWDEGMRMCREVEEKVFKR